MSESPTNPPDESPSKAATKQPPSIQAKRRRMAVNAAAVITLALTSYLTWTIWSDSENNAEGPGGAGEAQRMVPALWDAQGERLAPTRVVLMRTLDWAIERENLRLEHEASEERRREQAEADGTRFMPIPFKLPPIPDSGVETISVELERIEGEWRISNLHNALARKGVVGRMVDVLAGLERPSKPAELVTPKVADAAELPLGLSSISVTTSAGSSELILHDRYLARVKGEREVYDITGSLGSFRVIPESLPRHWRLHDWHARAVSVLPELMAYETRENLTEQIEWVQFSPYLNADQGDQPRKIQRGSPMIGTSDWVLLTPAADGLPGDGRRVASIADYMIHRVVVDGIAERKASAPVRLNHVQVGLKNGQVLRYGIGPLSGPGESVLLAIENEPVYYAISYTRARQLYPSVEQLTADVRVLNLSSSEAMASAWGFMVMPLSDESPVAGYSAMPLSEKEGSGRPKWRFTPAGAGGPQPARANIFPMVIAGLTQPLKALGPAMPAEWQKADFIAVEVDLGERLGRVKYHVARAAEGVEHGYFRLSADGPVLKLEARQAELLAPRMSEIEEMKLD